MPTSVCAAQRSLSIVVCTSAVVALGRITSEQAHFSSCAPVSGELVPTSGGGDLVILALGSTTSLAFLNHCWWQEKTAINAAEVLMSVNVAGRSRAVSATAGRVARSQDADVAKSRCSSHWTAIRGRLANTVHRPQYLLMPGEMSARQTEHCQHAGVLEGTLSV